MNKDQANPLVSLIVPCYNMELYIERFLLSVLDQTYTKIQFILVDDGSNDNSESIIMRYRNKLENKLSEFIYVKQKNGGAASAVNTALKYVKGKYLTWADSDDLLLPENVEKKVRYLEKNPQKDLVLCRAIQIDGETEKETGLLERNEPQGKDTLFEDLMISGIPCYPGVFMIRTKTLFDIIKDKTIYYNREVGQNWQLLLPVAYGNSCGYINDYLYLYYVHNDSHSHNVSLQKQLYRTYAQEEVLKNILNFIPDGQEKQEIFKKIRIKYSHQRMRLAFKLNDKGLAQKEYKILKIEDKVSKKEYIYILLLVIPSLKKLIFKIRRKI